MALDCVGSMPEDEATSRGQLLIMSLKGTQTILGGYCT